MSEDEDFDPAGEDIPEEDESSEFKDPEEDDDKPAPKKGKGATKAKQPKKEKATKPKKEPKEPKEPKETKKETKGKKKTKKNDEDENKEDKEEDKEVKETNEKSKRKKKEADKEQEVDLPNPYFYPSYSASHKAEFKEKFLEILGGISGSELEENKRDEIKDLIFQYEMHKRPQVIKEILDCVKEHFLSSGEIDIEKAKLMSSVYECLMDKIFQPLHLIQETLFFPSKESEARAAQILSKAKKTLEICVFAFTNNVLSKAVLDRHKAGVKVRIITDDECSKFFGADIWPLVFEGVDVTMDDNKKFHMHNKFVIIDDLVLATGSFNWTSQAVFGNQENLCIIDNPLFVKNYKEEFEKLWIQFAPNKITKEIATKHLEEEDAEKKRRVEKGKETRKRNKEEAAKKQKTGEEDNDSDKDDD